MTFFCAAPVLKQRGAVQLPGAETGSCRDTQLGADPSLEPQTQTEVVVLVFRISFPLIIVRQNVASEIFLVVVLNLYSFQENK